jgi:uncharacterized protein with PhoU and TrkA domain
LLAGVRQQKRSDVLINRGTGAGLEARCMISNMSPEAIYIESVIATVVKVIAVHGFEDIFAGATRRFDVIRRQDEVLVRGHEVGTRQIRSRRERKGLRDDVEADP